MKILYFVTYLGKNHLQVLAGQNVTAFLMCHIAYLTGKTNLEMVQRYGQALQLFFPSGFINLRTDLYNDSDTYLRYTKTYVRLRMSVRIMINKYITINAYSLFHEQLHLLQN